MVDSIHHHSQFLKEETSTGLGLQSSPAQSVKSEKNPFYADFVDISTDLYGGMFHDSVHGLKHSVILDLRMYWASFQPDFNDKITLPAMACEFLPVDATGMAEKIMPDDYIYHAVFIQFQLQMLEKILLFSREKEAASLVLVFNRNTRDNIEIYREYITLEQDVITPSGQEIHAYIPVCASLCTQVAETLGRLGQDFRQTLWRNQKINKAQQHYLHSHPL
jgi:hypothetical protein